MAKVDYQRFYSDEALDYDSKRYGSAYGALFRALQRAALFRALSEVGAPPGRILDVATGTGQMLPVLRATGAAVVASDLTVAMLGEARRIVGNSGIAYCVGNAFSLPYASGQFDVVASSRFLHLFDIAGQSELIREMARVLAPEGLLIVDFYSETGRRWARLPIWIYRTLLRKRPENDVRVTIEQAQEMLVASGLQPLRVEGVGNFLLALVPWLPFAWRLRVGEWMGRRYAWMSEQFMIVASLR